MATPALAAAPPAGAAVHGAEPPETSQIAEVWRLYRETGSAELRNRLIMQYAPLVKFVAGRIRSGLPQAVEPADLVSDGVFGLIDAIERFEPERGLAFQTYAVVRIRGAMLDALRTREWVPRVTREKARALDQAHATLQAELGRVPTEQEVAAELGITLPALRELYVHAARMQAPTDGDAVVVDGAPLPGDALDDEADRKALARYVRQLRERDQVLIALYYYEGFTFAEIALVFGVTESRVCQLHSAAMIALRAVAREAMEA